MTEPGLLLIPVVAVRAPLFARGLSPRVRVPIVVFERAPATPASLEE